MQLQSDVVVAAAGVAAMFAVSGVAAAVAAVARHDDGDYDGDEDEGGDDHDDDDCDVDDAGGHFLSFTLFILAAYPFGIEEYFSKS